MSKAVNLQKHALFLAYCKTTFLKNKIIIK